MTLPNKCPNLIDQDELELIKTMVPEADCMSYEDALALAKERVAKASEDFVESVVLAENVRPDIDVLSRQIALDSIPEIREIATRIGLVFLANAIDLVTVP